MLVLLLLACSRDPDDSDPVLTCPSDSLAAGETRVIASGFDAEDAPGTEGITFSPDGRLFVGGTAQGPGYVAEVHPDGTFTEIAPLPGSVGLAWWQDRVAVASGDSGQGDGTGGVLLVDPDTGEVRPLATGIPSANFPVVTPWGTLLVATHVGGSIVEVATDGAVTPWLTTISPNGLVFDATGTSLYVAQTYETPNVLRRVSIVDGQPGDVEEIATFEGAATQDGLAIDANGDVYVALNLPSKVVRVTPDGEVSDVGDVPSPRASPSAWATGTPAASTRRPCSPPTSSRSARASQDPRARARAASGDPPGSRGRRRPASAGRDRASRARDGRRGTTDRGGRRTCSRRPRPGRHP